MTIRLKSDYQKIPLKTPAFIWARSLVNQFTNCEDSSAKKKRGQWILMDLSYALANEKWLLYFCPAVLDLSNYASTNKLIAEKLHNIFLVCCSKLFSQLFTVTSLTCVLIEGPASHCCELCQMLNRSSLDGQLKNICVRIYAESMQQHRNYFSIVINDRILFKSLRIADLYW